jgi:polyphenol oxidase
VRNAPFGGSIENTVQNGIHYWTGSRTNPLGEDMGTFSSAGRDPVFYSHHTNVDRLWDVWRYRLFDGDDDERRDFNDTDFLDAEFVFYDEHSRMVSRRRQKISMLVAFRSSSRAHCLRCVVREVIDNNFLNTWNT